MPEAVSICKSCRSDNVVECDAEVKLHPLPMNGVGIPLACATSKLVVCLDCEAAQFKLSATELAALRHCNAIC